MSAIAMNRPRVALLLYPGCIEFEVALAAQTLAPRSDWRSFTPEGAAHHGADGSRRLVDGAFAELAAWAPHAVLVPGGDPGSILRDAAQRTALQAALQAAANQGAWMAGICAGALLLADAGVLDGRRATHNYTAEHASPTAVAVATPHFARIRFERADIVIDGRCITAQHWAHADFAAAVAEALGLIDAGEAERLRRLPQRRYVPLSPPPAPGAGTGGGGTESASAIHTALSRYDSATLVAALADDQQAAVDAVRRSAVALAAAVEAALPRLRAGGRLLYAGAGTSGRLGLLDSVELNPTFSWPPERAQALLAGGPQAVYRAVEGAEDDGPQGEADLRALQPTARDVLIAVAASGSTPYALGAQTAARTAGALTVALANNPGAPLLAQADCPVLLDTGAEIVSGSTRLKAGTAQKIALNTFSTALMVRLHKVYGNLMVDLRATNAKLRRRALRLTMQAAGADEAAAAAALAQCEQRVKTAILMLRCHLDAGSAQARLDALDGDLQRAIDLAPPPAAG